MPAFTLPPLKEAKFDEVKTTSEPQAISAWERRISIPVNQAILDVVRVDDPAEIVLRGTIKELRSSSQATDDTTINSNSITIEITDVECRTDDEERFREDVNRGYRRG